MAIPRDLECYYCRRGEHDRCSIPRSCACRVCYPRLVEGDDALSRLASFFTP